jgi:outer membrane biosynthesis protein TonB
MALGKKRMKHMTESSRTGLVTLLIILSLLMHGCLMIIMLLIKHTPSSFFEPPISFESPGNHTTLFDQQPAQTESDIPAALKPRASEFGTPQESSPADVEEHEPSANQSPDNQQEDQAPSNEPAPEKPAVASQEVSTSMFDTPPAVQLQPEKSPKKPPKKKRPAITQYVLDPADAPPRQITFADIARGFIQSVRNEGTDWLKRDGDPNKRPDPVEMRYLSYIQKVVWYLQSSFRQAELKQWPANQATISYKITLNKNGEIIKLDCTQSSGNQPLDSFMEKRIRNAGPFAPLPDHFKRTDFQIMLSLVVANGIAPEIAGYIACQQR